MKKIILVTLFSFLTSSISFSESSLPKCEGANRVNFHNCFGEYIFLGGSKYIGEWKNELPDGKGTMYYEYGGGGSKYIGQFKDGSPHGQGTSIWNNGNTYTGEWKNKKMDGQGTFVFSSGDRYEGEFKDDKFEGQATYTFKNGKIIKGIFKDGKLLRKKFENPIIKLN